MSTAIPNIDWEDVFSFVRPVLFRNDSEEFPFSVGSTCFLIEFRGHLFAVTTDHGVHGRELEEVRIPITATSFNCLPLRHVLGFPSGTEMSQSLDFTIFQIDTTRLTQAELALIKPLQTAYERAGGYRRKPERVLAFAGFPTSPKKFVDYDQKKVSLFFQTIVCRYTGYSLGAHSVKFDALHPAVTDFSGLSGAPVLECELGSFAVRSNRLAGMIVSGTIHSNRAHFIDGDRILEFLDCLYGPGRWNGGNV
jgi:hypothetical protein